MEYVISKEEQMAIEETTAYLEWAKINKPTAEQSKMYWIEKGIAEHRSFPNGSSYTVWGCNATIPVKGPGRSWYSGNPNIRRVGVGAGATGIHYSTQDQVYHYQA